MLQAAVRKDDFFEEVFFVKEFFEEDEESPDMELKICHLYPDVLNLYGDRGNIQCLQRRLAWRGIDCQVDFMGIGDYKSLSGYDLFCWKICACARVRRSGRRLKTERLFCASAAATR